MKLEINLGIGEKVTYRDNSLDKTSWALGEVSAITVRHNFDKKIFAIIELRDNSDKAKTIFNDAITNKVVTLKVSEQDFDMKPAEEVVVAITPKEARTEKRIHPDILRIVNEFLRQRYTRGSAIIKKDEIIALFLERNPVEEGYEQEARNKLIEQGHMDFEEVYHKQGWNVEYDSPSRGDSYEAYYKFSEK